MHKYDPKWSDMSNYVVHFTKEGDNYSSYHNMIGILSSGRIEARNAFGMSNYSPGLEKKKSVCFSEIPLHLIARIASRRESDKQQWYGIGFTKEFLESRGGGPVMYAPLGSPHEAAIQLMSQNARSNENDPFWIAAPYIERPGDHRGRRYRFEWEREWRHVGNFNFETMDVAFLIIPEELHELARRFFEEVRDEQTGPAYFCPYIAPDWSSERVKVVLENPMLQK